MNVAVIVDVDGTLVDSAYEHVLAWSRAFRAYDVVVPSWRIHRAVGMGGDQLIPDVAGRDVEERLGDRIREVERDAYAEYLPHIRAFPGAEPFLERCRELDAQVVLASSSKSSELERYLELLDAERLGLRWTKSDDVSRTKPEPDLIHRALEQVPGANGLMVGDATWDVLAASAAGIPTVALLTGGDGAHAVVEWVDLEQAERCREALLAIAREFCG